MVAIVVLPADAELSGVAVGVGHAVGGIGPEGVVETARGAGRAGRALRQSSIDLGDDGNGAGQNAAHHREGGQERSERDHDERM